MILKMYKVDDAVNVINKVKNNELVLNINLRQNFDIIKPVLLLSKNDTINFNDYNYLHLPELKRFYFIDEVTGVNNKLFSLMCSCDLLETYKDEILNSNTRYFRKIRQGDYFEGDLDMSTRKTVKKVFGNKEVELETTILITTIEDRPE